MSFDKVLDGIAVFAAVARSGSFAGAAATLKMSQPGVSRAVARLEKRLTARLFDRTPRSVAMTEDGQRLYSQILPHLAALETAVSSAEVGGTAVRGRLRVNVHPFFSRLFLAPLLGEFLEAHPGLRIDLIAREQLGDIISDGFDMAIQFGDPPHSSMIARKLLETRIVTVASPAYIEARGQPRHPSDLLHPAHASIDYLNPETSKPVDWEFYRNKERYSLPTQGKLLTNDVCTLHSACLAGYGVAQIMELGAEDLLTTGRLVDLFPDWPDRSFPLYAIYSSRTHLPGKTHAFLEFLSKLSSQIQNASNGTYAASS